MAKIRENKYIHKEFSKLATCDLRPIDILTGEIAIEVTGIVGVSPALWYFRYIASIFLTLHKRLWVNRVRETNKFIILA
jgi:hypothetical protein